MSWESVYLQVPGMIVLLAVVFQFLKHGSAMVTGFRETIEDSSKLTETCVDRMVSTHEKTVDSLDRNTEMFGRVETRLDQLNMIETERLLRDRESSDGPL